MNENQRDIEMKKLEIELEKLKKETEQTKNNLGCWAVLLFILCLD